MALIRVLFCFAVLLVCGAWTHGVGTSNLGWNDLFIGGGGYETGIVIASDGTNMVRSDTTPGLWLYNSSQKQYLPLITTSSTADLSTATAGGVFAMAIAPSNTQVLAMMWNGYVYISQNQGATWIKAANFSQVAASANDAPTKWYGPGMAFDPNNANILYVSTPANGLFKTTAALSPASASWSQVTAVGTATDPSGGSQGGGHAILFDTVSSGCTSPVGGVSQCIYADTFGTGWFRTTNGGSMWSAISSSATSGPITHFGSWIDPNGKLWTLDYVSTAGVNNNLWSYTVGGGWTEVLTSLNQFAWPTVDPANANHVAICAQGGTCFVSINGGSNWAEPTNYPTGTGAGAVASTDAPWQATPLGSNNYSFGSPAWDVTQSGVMYMSTGFTVLKGSPFASVSGSNVTFSWTTQIKGIETLDGVQIIACANGNLFATAQDIPLWKLTPGTLPTAYLPPSNYNGLTPNNNVTLGFSVSCAEGNSNIVAAIMDFESADADISGYSLDGGSTWTAFGSTPGASFGGAILAIDSTDFLWAPVSNGIPYYWNGSSWTESNLPAGVCATSVFIFCKPFAVDTTTGDIYTFIPEAISVTYAGIWESTDKGHTWSKVSGSTDPDDQFAAATFAAYPGNAQEFWYTGGFHDVGSHPDTSVHLWHWVSAAWVEDTSWDEPMGVGFGAACSGHTNSAIYVVGWHGGTATSNYGLYESCDDGATWTQLGSPSCSTVNNCNVPYGNFAPVLSVDGDKNVPGEAYISFANGGFAYYRTN